MMQSGPRRILIGLGLGAFAGLSLITGVLPFILTRLFGINSFEILILVNPFTLPVALLWAIGGGAIGHRGGRTTSAGIWGACGAVTGLGLGLFALEGGLSLGLASMLTGLIYGMIGGLLVGYSFPSEMPQLEEPQE